MKLSCPKGLCRPVVRIFCEEYVLQILLVNYSPLGDHEKVDRMKKFLFDISLRAFEHVGYPLGALPMHTIGMRKSVS